MANRRMFSRDVVETDKFLDMPITTQALYFHLGMEADEDGFVSSPKTVQRATGCAEGDLTTLIQNGFVELTENGLRLKTSRCGKIGETINEGVD